MPWIHIAVAPTQLFRTAAVQAPRLILEFVRVVQF